MSRVHRRRFADINIETILDDALPVAAFAAAPARLATDGRVLHRQRWRHPYVTVCVLHILTSTVRSVNDVQVSTRVEQEFDDLGQRDNRHAHPQAQLPTDVRQQLTGRVVHLLLRLDHVAVGDVDVQTGRSLAWRSTDWTGRSGRRTARPCPRPRGPGSAGGRIPFRRCHCTPRHRRNCRLANATGCTRRRTRSRCMEGSIWIDTTQTGNDFKTGCFPGTKFSKTLDELKYNFGMISYRKLYLSFTQVSYTILRIKPQISRSEFLT